MPNKRLHITNGEVANQFFRSLGLSGDFLSWDDVLHIGPITNHASLTRASNLRAGYLASLGWGSLESIQQKFANRDQRFFEAVRAIDSEIVIWNSFEPFDQLHLMQICHWLYVNAPDFNRVKVIFVEGYLGEGNLAEGTVSEGRLRKDSLAEKEEPAAYWTDLAQQPPALSFAQIQLGHQCWEAYSEATPQALVDIYVSQGLSSWPFLKQALVRLIRDIPDKKSGIGRSEMLILKSLRKQSLPLEQMFLALSKSESTRFIGDSAFLVILEELIHSDMPLIEPEDHGPFNRIQCAYPSREWSERYFSLTEAGEAVLTMRVDWLNQHAINRWWGGCHLTSINDWRWDQSANQLVEYSRHLN
jgi:hypothetical protein